MLAQMGAVGYLVYVSLRSNCDLIQALVLKGAGVEGDPVPPHVMSRSGLPEHKSNVMFGELLIHSLHNPFPSLILEVSMQQDKLQHIIDN